jgi:hypothetical protein
MGPLFRAEPSNASAGRQMRARGAPGISSIPVNFVRVLGVFSKAAGGLPVTRRAAPAIHGAFSAVLNVKSAASLAQDSQRERSLTFQFFGVAP